MSASRSVARRAAHVRNATGVNALRPSGALLALSLVISTAIVANRN